uniref:Uncharacterized protein n=1 Tax=Araucaria cunninghamii TaxID=56994 RepID=A0A0D6QST4_ARACU
MYSTISLANYRQVAAAANVQQQTGVLFPPPAGPYSAYLLLQDEEEDDNDGASCCWGCCKDRRVRELPFPQDKCLSILYTTTSCVGGQIHRETQCDRVYFIPVLGQPISSNSYYVVQAEGKHKGLVTTCSTEQDMVTFCCCKCVHDVRPGPLQPNNPYQQVEIIRKKSRFTATCAASDGFPPQFLRRHNWRVKAHDLRGKHGRLAHVKGEDASLRALLPPFDFSLSHKTSSVVIVGEWYCPFIFIKEMGTSLEDPKTQLMECPFYKMLLEKFWEEIYSVDVGIAGEDVFVQKTVRVEGGLLFGEESVEEVADDDTSVWFKGIGNRLGKACGVRLSWPIIAKIRADQGRTGSGGGGRDVRVEKSFSRAGTGRKFRCYVVVERYVLKRMDGSIALTYSFRNCDQIQGKWE